MNMKFYYNEIRVVTDVSQLEADFEGDFYIGKNTEPDGLVEWHRDDNGKDRMVKVEVEEDNNGENNESKAN